MGQGGFDRAAFMHLNFFIPNILQKHYTTRDSFKAVTHRAVAKNCAPDALAQDAERIDVARAAAHDWYVAACTACLTPLGRPRNNACKPRGVAC